jgi:hypothetical protein
LIRQARRDRLLPGSGGIDLMGPLGAVPADLPIGVEIALAQPMPPLERAVLARQTSLEVLAQLAQATAGGRATRRLATSASTAQTT